MLSRSRAGSRWAVYDFGTVSYSLFFLHVPIGGRIISPGERHVVNELDSVLILSTVAARPYYFYVEHPPRLLASHVQLVANLAKLQR